MTKQEEPATKKYLEKMEQKLQKAEERLGAKIDANAANINHVEQTLSAKIDANSAKIDANGAKIDANSATLSRLTSLVLDNRERMATKEDMHKIDKRFDELIGGIDSLARSFSILEDEKVVINKRLDRIEAKLA